LLIKKAATSSELKELKDNLRELKMNEMTYKKQKDDEKRKEVEYVISKESEMSNILIELDVSHVSDLFHNFK